LLIEADEIVEITSLPLVSLTDGIIGWRFLLP